MDWAPFWINALSLSCQPTNMTCAITYCSGSSRGFSAASATSWDLIRAWLRLLSVSTNCNHLVVPSIKIVFLLKHSLKDKTYVLFANLGWNLWVFVVWFSFTRTGQDLLHFVFMQFIFSWICASLLRDLWLWCDVMWSLCVLYVCLARCNALYIWLTPKERCVTQRRLQLPWGEHCSIW